MTEMMDAAKRTWTACWSSFFTHIATGMVLERSLILTVAVFVWPLSSARAQHDVSVLSHGAAAVVHVRPITPQLKKLVDTGYALSTTFRGVVDGLEGSSVIVHLVPDDALAPDLDGALQFVTTTPGFRYLRVFIRTDLESAVLIAVLAHELQHAAEIGQTPSVVDVGSLRALYRATGVRSCLDSHLECYDTTLAQNTGKLVYAEILGASSLPRRRTPDHSAKTHAIVPLTGG